MIVNGDAELRPRGSKIVIGDTICGCNCGGGSVKDFSCKSVTCTCGQSYLMTPAGTLTKKGGGLARSAFELFS